jgi:stearoyl-CoA desaturase (Delta-9 desaturase)
MFALVTILFPVLVPYYYWNECLWISFWTCFVCRFCTTLNIAFSVNSVAHMFGDKPYDKNISPVESLPVAIAAMGEGFHNYHVRMGRFRSSFMVLLTFGLCILARFPVSRQLGWL